MKTLLQIFVISISSLLFLACKDKTNKTQDQANKSSETKEQKVKQDSGFTTVQTAIGDLRLPPPYHTKALTKISQIVNWEKDEYPKAPKGFKVTRFADNLKHPRRTYVANNGDYFVAESDGAKKSANQIRLLRDTNADGMPDENHIFLENLNQPYGMLLLDGYFYVANVDAIVRFPYKKGQTKITAKPEKILDLPSGGYNHHWTRNLIANADGSKIYVSVGSSSNVGEHGMEKEKRRANILEINPDGSGEIIYASGIRNPVGMDWNPVTGELWTAVNERDALGDNLVPDYATSVKKDAWYGWPYSYYGQIKDPRWEDEPHLDKVEKAIIPDVPLGSHTASLGFQFYTANQFPEKYKNGAFVGQHGSWNRSKFAGYKVVFIPFENGKPQPPQDFLSGFIKNKEESLVHGRPVGVAQAHDGSLLVNDDDAGIIWRITKE